MSSRGLRDSEVNFAPGDDDDDDYEPEEGAPSGRPSQGAESEGLDPDLEIPVDELPRADEEDDEEEEEELEDIPPPEEPADPNDPVYKAALVRAIQAIGFCS